MLPSLLPEAGGVAHILERQLTLLKPLASVHGAQRLLAGGDEVLVLTVWACRQQDLCIPPESFPGLGQKHMSPIFRHIGQLSGTISYRLGLCRVSSQAMDAAHNEGQSCCLGLHAP